jgi:1-aminocyclopropane-1-carboxylate deaminase/D-cysteine desulfhydrase-like pyridoxal-dependent ACC family enzyme
MIRAQLVDTDLVGDLSPTEDPSALTPVHRAGSVWLKRDDLFTYGGVYGGKARACLWLARGASGGLVTAGARQSPQCSIVAAIAQRLGLSCRVHTAAGSITHELALAQSLGAELVQHKVGYNSVIVARARADAARLCWRLIPFGMECGEAVAATAAQTKNLPTALARIVVPVGSGITLAGILTGFAHAGRSVRVIGVVVGADPTKRLERWAPPGWPKSVRLIGAGVPYKNASNVNIHGVSLDPIYEAKCQTFLRKNDCLWIVGIRNSVQMGSSANRP